MKDKAGFAEGDTIGCEIYLPPGRPHIPPSFAKSFKQ